MLNPWTCTAESESVARTLDPIANDVAFNDSTESESPYLYNRSLTSNLVLVGEDFDWLRAIDQAGCAAVTITLTRGGYSYTGEVDLKKLRFEDSRCNVTVQLKSSEPHSCILDKKGEDVDVMRSLSLARYNVYLGAGEIEYFRHPVSNEFEYFASSPTSVDVSFPPPVGEGWALDYRRFTNIFASNNPGLNKADIIIGYAREVITTTGTPPGDGWVSIGGNDYARSPNFGNASATFSEDGREYTYFREAFSSDEFIDNCFSFVEMVDEMVESCGLTWQSVFFGKGAPATPDPLVYDATVYDKAYANLHSLTLCQKSDAKRRSDGQNASSGLLSWEDVLQVFAAFNCLISEVSDVLVVEHYSYYKRTADLNLTTSPYAEQIAGLMRYEGRGDDLPGRVKFQWMDQTSEIWDGVPITYDCGDTSNTSDVPLKRFTSNVIAMLDNNPQIDDFGFALMAPAEFDGKLSLVSQTNSMFPAVSPLNGALSFPNIQDAYHRHGANYPIGYVNESLVTFESTKPQRKTTARIKLPFDVWESFDPAKDVTTAYGGFRVASADWSDRDSALSLELEG